MILTKCGSQVCGMNVTSYNPRLHATTSALTVLVAVETTNSNVPSPAPIASQLKVTGTPNDVGPLCCSNPVIVTRDTSKTLHENGEPPICCSLAVKKNSKCL